MLIATGSGDMDYLGYLDCFSHGSHVGLPGSQMPEVLVTAGLEHFLHAIVGIILTLYNNRLCLLLWSLAGNSVCNIAFVITWLVLLLNIVVTVVLVTLLEIIF